VPDFADEPEWTYQPEEATMHTEPRLIHPDGTVVPQVRAWLRAAVAAPSVYNTQPWLFRVTEREIEVYADPARRLDVVDPRGRELMISVGAALFNLRVAMLVDGRTPIVRLLPDDANPDLVARVRPGASGAVSETVRLLAEAIPRRHTNRRPFEPTPVPPEVLADLCVAAEVEGGSLVVAEPALRDAVLGVVRSAEHRRRRDPDYYVEMAHWTVESGARGDGVPPETFGPWSALEVVPLRDFGLVRPVPRRVEAEYESEPTIALLYSRGDDREQWVRAGQALERTLLTASVRGLASTLMTQPIEIPAMRELFTVSATDAVAQVVLRFGYGPPSAPSPRRSLRSVLLNDSVLHDVR
jgi:nitroreductase